METMVVVVVAAGGSREGGGESQIKGVESGGCRLNSVDVGRQSPPPQLRTSINGWADVSGQGTSVGWAVVRTGLRWLTFCDLTAGPSLRRAEVCRLGAHA